MSDLKEARKALAKAKIHDQKQIRKHLNAIDEILREKIAINPKGVDVTGYTLVGECIFGAKKILDTM